MNKEWPISLVGLLDTRCRWEFWNDTVIVTNSQNMVHHYHGPALDSLYPGLYMHLCAQHVFFSRSMRRAKGLSGPEVEALRDYLQSGGIRVELSPVAGSDKHFRNNDGTFLYSRINEVHLYKNGKGEPTVCLIGTQIVADRQYYQNQPYMVIARQQTVNHTTSLDEHEQYYPDWEKRYILGTELGLAKDELANFLFSPSHKPVSTMDSITFE